MRKPTAGNREIREVHMSTRFLSALGALVVIGLVTSVSVEGQRPAGGTKAERAASTKTWTAALTPDGQPDLQGVWVGRTATPLERPKALEGRTFLTDDEVAEFKRRAVRIFGGGETDGAGADQYFLAVLANVEHYKSPNS